MARLEAEGKKLTDQEKWKREQHPFDAYARLEEQAAHNEFPKPADNFRWRFFGLFYVGPTQDSYMCRLRIPNGILNHWQFAGLADVADRYAGGYANVTTRANLQIREIAAKDAPHVLESILDLGLCSRGTGADNIRNVTGDATAGIDAQALIDTRPYTRAWHFHVLNDRSLTGLPRKFNISFDGGGAIPTLEETNDIGFQAVEVRAGGPVPEGIYLRVVLGGITGHKDIARNTGVIIKPEEATRVADAIVRVFIDHGDRTNRTKARLKYVLDAWGFDKFLKAVEDKLGFSLAAHRRKPYCAAARAKPASAYRRPSPEAGRALLSRRRSARSANSRPRRCANSRASRAIAAMAIMRLTVWQNLLISGIAEERLHEAQSRIEAIGLDWKASSIRAGLIACTGSRGCKFSASDTKGHAEEIAQWCESRIRLDQPINIHLTGCHHSCAQHYIGDIGLCGARVAIGDDGDTVEGYHVVIGGGFGSTASIGREIFRDVKAEAAPQLVERLLKAYLARRESPAESFHQFTARHEIAALQKFVEDIAAAGTRGWGDEPMSFAGPPPAMVPLLPENAPFSPEQRAWLNGLFAGLLAPTDIFPVPISADTFAALTSERAPQQDIDDGAPWHDPALALEERMKRAEGRPLRRRLMAAMAQQDCGQCGYLCETYADAIASGAETRLNLCVPGEKPTLRALKALVEEAPAAPTPAPKITVPAQPAPQKPPGYAREVPVDVTFHARRKLTKEGSEKSAYHIEFDLDGQRPRLCRRRQFRHLSAKRSGAGRCGACRDPRAAEFSDHGPHAARRSACAIWRSMSRPTLCSNFSLISPAANGGRKPRRWRRAKIRMAMRATLDVLAAFEKFPGVYPDPEALVECLDTLQPRLYSISSSPKLIPGRLSLTVDHVRYFVGERLRHGVASSFLAERASEGERLKAYIQRAHDFALPAQGSTPIIMIGPGTGIAPFRAFLQERQAQKATGGAWLFFGHQHRATDFFYEEEMEAFLKARRAEPSLARLVARRREESLCAGQAAGSRQANLGLDRARRASLCLRRRLTHGGRCRESAHRHRRRTDQERCGVRPPIRPGDEEGRQLSDGCVLRAKALMLRDAAFGSSSA